MHFSRRQKTVKTGIKFIIRDIAQQQVGEHTEKQLRQKEGRDAHPERKGVGVLPNEEERSEEAVRGRASLVAQWLRICLPMQGTRVRALVWEDPTCRGATRPVSHNY